MPRDLVPDAVAFLEDQLFSAQVEKLKALRLADLVFNPFSADFAAETLTGGALTARSLAEALVHPRALGSSLSTSVGQQLRRLCSRFPGVTVRGRNAQEVEFDDLVDGTHRYGRFAGGPNNLNSRSASQLVASLAAMKAKGGRGGVPIADSQLTVCVTHGVASDLNPSFVYIGRTHSLLVGQDLWHRITGDLTFYSRITKSIATSSGRVSAHAAFELAIDRIEAEISAHPDLSRLI